MMKYKSEFVFDSICNLENKDTVIEFSDFQEGLKQLLRDTDNKKNVIFEKKDLRFIDRLEFYKKFLFTSYRDYIVSIIILLINVIALAVNNTNLMFIGSLGLSVNFYMALKELIKFKLDLSKLHIIVRDRAIKPRLFFIASSLPLMVIMIKLRIVLSLISVLINVAILYSLFYFKIKEYSLLLEDYDKLFEETLYYERTELNTIAFVNEIDESYSEVRKSVYSSKSQKVTSKVKPFKRKGARRHLDETEN